MPITLRALAQDRQSLRIDYGDAGDLNVTYTPSMITEKLLKSMGGVTEKTAIGDAADIVNDTLCRLVVAWDLTDDDGNTIPLTPDGMGDVPLLVRVGILNRIVSEFALGEWNGTPSKRRSPKRS